MESEALLKSRKSARLRAGLLWATRGPLAALCVAASLAALHSTGADAQDAESGVKGRQSESRGLIRPRRLTVGDHNHFMGVLGPRGRYLYYVTDEFNTYDLFVQSPISSSGQPAFEAFGDIVWPAVSPDGEYLAYIRYESDSQGDACRRRIRENGRARDNREKCHATDEADLQIYWRSDGRLGVLLREELHGDHVLLDGAFDKEAERRPANVVGLALSPDDRWVAYVPLSRLREEIGVSFSNRVGDEGIRIRRVGQGTTEHTYKPRLPGVSGYPQFSPDGAYLYFSQFLNDTNRDGVIDGDDNGVVFRMPFHAEADQPKFGEPRQLTNARWNCHYPSVREDAMALTCGIRKNLHIYLLPPSGTVPNEWHRPRIAAEAAAVRDPWSELLLRQHLWVEASSPSERSEQLQALTKLHLDLREYEAAIYYGEQRKELLRAEGVNDWWSEMIILLAKHLRADRALARGRFSEEYVDESKAMIEAVEAAKTDDSADAKVLRALISSKIHSDIGNKAVAARLLDEINVTPVRDETILDLAFQQFNDFYALLADYDTRLARLKEVALHPVSSVTQTLRHSNGFIILLQRGQPQERRLDRLTDARTTVPDGSRLALAMDLEIALYNLTNENVQEVEEHLVRLYERIENRHVRRYLIVSALRASHRQGVESLQHDLVELWAQSVERGDPEQRSSAALYRAVVMERAYGALASGDYRTAARYFDKARRATGSLAGHVGWIETQLLLDKEIAEDFQFDSPAAERFVNAYLLARDLGSIDRNAELDKTVSRARALLEAAIEEDPHQPLAHLLLAHAVHHRGMRFGDRENIALAIRHYLLALDLADGRPRVRAAAHSGMTLAQASIGNHRRALQDYEARFELPIISAEERASLLVGYARSLFHVYKQPEAIAALTQALTLLQSNELERYEPMVLDRLALYQLDAERPERSIQTHDELRQVLENRPGGRSAINEIKADARLATAYLETDAPEQALRSARLGRRRLTEADPLRAEVAERRIRPVIHGFVYHQEELDVLLAGLEATAARKVGDLDQTRASLLSRKHTIEARYAKQEVDEDLMMLAHTCLRLAEVAQQRGDFLETKAYLEEGLAYEEQHASRTGSEVSEVGFHLLRAYAELHFEGGVALSTYERDLEAELLRYYLFLSEVRNPEWELERKRFEMFLSLLQMENPPISQD